MIDCVAAQPMHDNDDGCCCLLLISSFWFISTICCVISTTRTVIIIIVLLICTVVEVLSLFLFSVLFYVYENQFWNHLFYIRTWEKALFLQCYIDSTNNGLVVSNFEQVKTRHIIPPPSLGIEISTMYYSTNIYFLALFAFAWN